MTLEEAIKKVTKAGDEVVFPCKAMQKAYKGVVVIRFWSEGAPPNMSIFESYERFLERVEEIYKDEETHDKYTITNFYHKCRH